MELNSCGYDAQAYSNGMEGYILSQQRARAVAIERTKPRTLDRYKYARFELQNEELSSECAARMRALGVECLMEGRAFEAYGIVIDDDVVRTLLLRDPEIFAIDDEEPPSGK